MTLELYLLRHGIAEENSHSGRDMDRALTPDGRIGLTEVVSQAIASGLTPRHIVASPYLRAMQSAEVAAQIIEHADLILTSTRLTPDSSPASLWQEVREIGEGPLLIVSHEPLLSKSAAWMTGETRVIIEFSPATLIRIDFDSLDREPRGQLRWKIDGR